MQTARIICLKFRKNQNNYLFLRALLYFENMYKIKDFTFPEFLECVSF